MNPQLYQAMIQAQNPQQAQQQVMAAYHPAQLQQSGGQSQMGMSIGQMGQDVMQRKMRDANQVAQLDATGGF